MTVNGQPMAFSLDPATPLLFALRDAVNLTSPKYGCDDASCHACTVLVDGQATQSCRLSIARAEGAMVTTVEGLEQDHPLFEAWEAEQVSMCGFCDPGFICAIAGLLTVNAAPTRAEVESLPNRCPCGAAPRIAAAIERAAAAIRSGEARNDEPPLASDGFSLGSGG